MRADEARRLTEEKQKKDKVFQEFVEYTEQEIRESIERGRRKAVMFTNYNLREALIKHWENLGYKVIREPPKTTLYVVW